MTAPAVETATAAIAGGVGAEQSSAALAGVARAAQAAIAARAMQDAIAVWPLLDPKRLNETFPGWLRAMIVLTNGYRAQSSQAAATAYRALRSKATRSPAPSSLIQLAPDANDQWLSRAFGFSGPGMLNRDTARPNTALTTTVGTTARIVQDGGRTTTLNTIQTDPVAVGWYRVTDGNPCAFCALLAARPALKGRGSLYRSEQSAGFQAHNHCGCSAAPLFDRNEELPDVNQRAAEIYRTRGKGPALQAFRTAWNANQAS